jgi:hypothetical protein
MEKQKKIKKSHNKICSTAIYHNLKSRIIRLIWFFILIDSWIKWNSYIYHWKFVFHENTNNYDLKNIICVVKYFSH